MKLEITRKAKNCLLFSILLALVLCVFGFFGVLNKKDERITANAAESTNSDRLYWEEGASIAINLYDTRRIRFRLHVHKDVLENGDLTITLNNGGNKDCFFDVYGYTGSIEDTSSNHLGDNPDFVASITETQIQFDADKMQSLFSDRDWVVIWVGAVSDIDTSISMTASNSGYTAVSVSRSWLYVYNVFGEMGSTGSTWEESIADFAASASSSNSFAICDNYWLDPVLGLEIVVNVPQTYKDKVAAGQQLVEKIEGEIRGQKYNTYLRYEEYFLSFHRKNDSAPDITSSNWDENSVVHTYTTIPTELKDGTILELCDNPRSGNMNGGRYYYMGLVKKTTEYRRGGLYGLEMLGPTISYEVVDNTNDIEVNVADKAWAIVSEYDSALFESEREWLLDLAGTVPQTDTIPVNIKYKALLDANDPSSIVLKNDKNFLAKRVDIASKRLVTQTMYDLLEGISSLADFNVCYQGRFWQNGDVYNTGERIILQATDYAYTYDSATQTGTLEVLYNEFQYKELALRVINNDIESNLEMLCYTTDVEMDASTNVVTMRWDFAMLEETLYNTCKWHFTLSEGNFQIRNNPSSLTYYYEKANNIPTALALQFPLDTENELVGVDIVVGVYIEPVVDCNVTYQYVKLSMDDSNNIVEETVTSDTFIIDSIELKSYNYTNFMADFGEIIEASLVLDGVEGVYCYPVAVQRNSNGEDADGTPSYTFVVQYEYNTLFKITNNASSDIRFVELNDASQLYYGSDFVRSGDIPDGRRVEKFTSTSSDVRITADAENADDYAKTKIYVLINVNQKKIIPIHITYTDKWHLTFEYFETYKNTPFALKKTYLGDISVKDYPNIREMTATDICTATGIPATVINIIKLDEKVDIAFDNISLYTATLGYGMASITSTDYEGNRKEIRVPINKYEDWVAGMGNPDWTIMMLNTEQNKYFQYSNEVERDKLYGLFSTAVFEEEVSDLNFYFRNNTGDGCMTIFEKTKASGSKVYKFFYKWTDKEVTEVPGRVGMFFCELVNDDNKILHSYSFYLDGSTTDTYISNGGADDRYDDDSALENKGEDIKDNIEGIWNDAKGWYDELTKSPWGIAIQAALGIVGVVAVGGICVWIWRFFTGKPKKRRKKK